jgi:hypothetical protein
MMKTKIFLILVLLLGAAAGGFALDVVQGNVKLTLYEKTGRFNVFIDKPGGAGKPFAFFTREDPRTTALQVLADNNLYTMGDGGGFKQTLEKTATGARFVWRSAKLKVTEEFIFLTPTDVPLTEGVKIVIRVDNTAEAAQTIGVRYLFDTWLGEKSGTHFVTSANATVAREAALKTPVGGSYWISPFIDSATGDGLLVLTDSQYVTQPEAVVFANWKRLFEANWEYHSLPNLDFTYQPYSFNDSAVGQYYPKLKAEKKTGREVVLVLGNAASYAVPKTTLIADKRLDPAADDKNKLVDITDRPVDDKTVDVAKTEPADDIKKAVPAVTRFSGSIMKNLTRSNYDLVKFELARIDQYVADLNAKLLSGKSPAEDEYTTLRATLADLESKAMLKE